MKSRITIEVDFENGNAPVIQILKFNNDGEVQEDVRDKLISVFLEKLGYASSWCKIEWAQNHCVDGRTVHQRVNISPIAPGDLKKEADIMLAQSGMLKDGYSVAPMVNVYGNSDAFREFLDKEKVVYKPNEHYTLIDASVDLFDLGQRFHKFKVDHNAALA